MLLAAPSFTASAPEIQKRSHLGSMLTVVLLPTQPPTASKRRSLFRRVPVPTTAVSSSFNQSLQETLSALIDRSKSLTHLRQTHAVVLRHGLHLHHILNFKLQRAYSSLGHLDYSINIFNSTPDLDVYNWTAVIHAQTRLGSHDRAMFYFVDMLHCEGVQPNAFTFSAVLKSSPLATGKSLHSLAFKFRLHLDLYVMTSLLDVYARGGDVNSAEKLFDRMPKRSLVSLTAMITCYTRHGLLDKARKLFDEMPERDVVCWNVMIDGYAQNGRPEEAMLLFRQMMLEAKIHPNQLTVLSVLSACGQLGALESGRWLHNFTRNTSIEINRVLGTALIDMYSRCGSLEDASVVFEKMNGKDVAAWNSMIAGYAMHGFSQTSLEMLDKMCAEGLVPNDITFIAVLNGCGHTGLVKQGRYIFNRMQIKYGIEPKVEHYGCMVNLLGRAGHLEEAYELVKSMKIEPDNVIWGTLLGSCRLHQNLKLGEEIVEFLVKSGSANSGTYTLLSNIHAASGNWGEVARLRSLMKSSGVTKEKGCSSIVVNNTFHEFVAGDGGHPKSWEIYQMLEEMNNWLAEKGYVAKIDTVLQDLGDEEKEQSLEVHSERLALAFGLVSTKPGTAIRIVKNLRVCADCHVVMKLISEITGRKIIMRDRSRFHHFVDGLCSCKDYW